MANQYNNVYAKPVYYFTWSQALSFPEDISVDVEFQYITETTTTATFNDGGALAGTYNTLADLVTALNGAQTIFEFFELNSNDQKRCAEGIDTLGVRSKDYFIPENYGGSITITFDSTAETNDTLFSLMPDNTSQDQTTAEVKKIADNTQGTARAVTHTVVNNAGNIAAGAKYIYVNNTGGAAATFNGYSMPATSDLPPLTAVGADTLPQIAYDATGTTLLIVLIF